MPPKSSSASKSASKYPKFQVSPLVKKQLANLEKEFESTFRRVRKENITKPGTSGILGKIKKSLFGDDGTVYNLEKIRKNNDLIRICEKLEKMMYDYGQCADKDFEKKVHTTMKKIQDVLKKLGLRGQPFLPYEVTPRDTDEFYVCFERLVNLSDKFGQCKRYIQENSTEMRNRIGEILSNLDTKIENLGNCKDNFSVVKSKSGDLTELVDSTFAKYSYLEDLVKAMRKNINAGEEFSPVAGRTRSIAEELENIFEVYERLKSDGENLRRSVRQEADAIGRAIDSLNGYTANGGGIDACIKTIKDGISELNSMLDRMDLRSLLPLKELVQRLGEYETIMRKETDDLVKRCDDSIQKNINVFSKTVKKFFEKEGVYRANCLLAQIEEIQKGIEKHNIFRSNLLGKFVQDMNSPTDKDIDSDVNLKGRKEQIKKDFSWNKLSVSCVTLLNGKCNCGNIRRFDHAKYWNSRNSWMPSVFSGNIAIPSIEKSKIKGPSYAIVDNNGKLCLKDLQFKTEAEVIEFVKQSFCLGHWVNN
jgi:hypothetical protein